MRDQTEVATLNNSPPQAGAETGETGVDLTAMTNELESEMLAAANNLEFEKAALLRDQFRERKRAIDGSQPARGKVAGYRKPSRQRARR